MTYMARKLLNPRKFWHQGLEHVFGHQNFFNVLGQHIDRDVGGPHICSNLKRPKFGYLLNCICSDECAHLSMNINGANKHGAALSIFSRPIAATLETAL